VLPWLVELEFHLCQWPAAAVHAEMGMQIARDTGQQSRINEFQAFLACLAAVQGDAARCEALAEQALDGAYRRGNQLVAARATWALAHLALSEGDPQEAYDRLVDLHTPESPCAHQHIARITMPDLVDAAVRCERVDYVKALVAEYREWVITTSLPWAYSHLHVCEALLAHGERADELFQSALSAEPTQDRPFDSARIALRYGEWLRRNRHTSDARRQLRAASAQFDRLGATIWNRNAQTQLRAIGGTGSVPRFEHNTIGVLTTQELQVAQLAAQGLSNREIGARLFLSPRTVGYHLYKLFPKLGIAARSQLRGMDFGDRLPDVS
jgi:ATP/maltotriose-dependent transcriptional regulator MalT